MRTILSVRRSQIILSIAAFWFAILLGSCTSPVGQSQELLTKTSTPVMIVKPIITPALHSTTTPEMLQRKPEITATPIHIDVSSKNVLNDRFKSLYFITACKQDLLAGPLEPLPTETFKAPKPEFIEVDARSNPYVYSISEIADNDDHSYQAFVACEADNCHPKIFLKNSTDGEIYEINWNGRMSWRDIGGVIWINHDVVAFFQSNSPQVGQVLAVDVEKKDFVYYSLIRYDCPLQ